MDTITGQPPPRHGQSGAERLLPRARRHTSLMFPLQAAGYQSDKQWLGPEPLTRRQPFPCTVARISSGNGEQHMGYTLGQAAKAVGMSKTSILRSIKTGRISAGRDEFGQWAIEPCELHRIYPPLADDTGTGNGTEGRGVTGGEPALAEATTRATLAEARLSDFKSMLDDIREQRDRWQQQAERLAALAITDQRKERSPAQPQSWRQMLRAPTGQLLFLWVVGLLCGGVLLSTVRLSFF
jgi:hypothetical protein